MPTRDEELDEMISIRISKSDLAEIQRLAKTLLLKPMTISRICLRAGIDAMDRDPGRTMREVGEARTPRPHRRKPKPKRRRGT